MVDSKLLNEKIDVSGLKKSYIAKQIGISRSGLYNKVNNVNEFTSREIDILCNLLAITKLTEKESIFFAKRVN